LVTKNDDIVVIISPRMFSHFGIYVASIHIREFELLMDIIGDLFVTVHAVFCVFILS